MFNSFNIIYRGFSINLLQKKSLTNTKNKRLITSHVNRNYRNNYIMRCKHTLS